MFLCGIKKTLTTNFQFIETHQLHRVYFKGVMCHVSTKIFNFQLSIFNSIETHQLHRVYFQWCNVSRLYKNFQFSTFNFQFSDSQFLNLLKLSKRVPVGHK